MNEPHNPHGYVHANAFTAAPHVQSMCNMIMDSDPFQYAFGGSVLTLADTGAYLAQQLGVYNACDDLDGMVDCCDDTPPWLQDERGVTVGL